MDKVIFVDKPTGMTSFDVVSKCRKIFHEKKIGHTGTLDPNASGLMILLLGKYTKYLPYCVHHHKKYQATFQFGLKTETEDIWGNIIEERDPLSHSQEELTKIAQSMIGEYDQIPPMYSAIKYQGKKLYEYARQGIEVPRESRTCTIYDLEVLKQDNDYEMIADVSSGTYIRTLIGDYASKLSEIATMTSLRRLSIEQHTLDQAYSLEELQEDSVDSCSILELLDPLLPQIEVEDAEPIIHGKAMYLPCEEEVVILTFQGTVLAAYEKSNDGQYHCKRGLF